MKRTTPFLGLGLLVAWGLKSLFSRAGADDLGWILAPTCRLAELLSDVEFEREFGAGWVDHTHRMIVGASCSG
ncbi:MAG: exosortase K, partial [Candidatus Rokuibacteriota bacterium]